jgi:hypothetical protein
MPKFAHFTTNFALAGIVLFCCAGVRSDTVRHPAGRLASLPRVTLWAWERREDFRSLPASRIAVAYLDRTLTIGINVQSQVRLEPLWLPSSTSRIAVVRIETSPEALFNPDNLDQAVRAILVSAREPGIAALQIDFDAARSQRAFYRSMLFTLRRQMPPGLPLSITALASWCSWDRWLPGLPVDEAVPMMFRMEPDRRRGSPNRNDFQIREPLCAGSAGVSTTEPWPDDLADKRVYIFSDRGWRRDVATAVERKLP